MCYYVIILIEYEYELSFDTRVVEMPSGGVFPRAAKTPFCTHFAHTHTENPRVYSKKITTTCKKQTKTKTNANRSQNYKTKTNYIIKYLYTGILRGDGCLRVGFREAPMRVSAFVSDNRIYRTWAQNFNLITTTEKCAH